MSSSAPRRLELDPASSRDMDRRMLLLTVIFWLAHMALLSTRALIGKAAPAGIDANIARLATAVLGMVLTYGLYMVLKRAPARDGLARFAWAAAGSVLACALLTAGNGVAFYVFVPDVRAWAGDLVKPSMLLINYTYFFLEFIAWSALFATVVGSAELRDRDRRLALAESAAHQARLSALRMQMQPHFLFNTLNTLSGLIALGRSSQAEQLILNLSALMRRSLTAAPDSLEPLSEELEAQMMYLSIELARFPDRLELRREIEPECASALAPPMILQPLVENAVKHGVAPAEGRTVVTVGAARRGDRLELWVRNQGGPATSFATSGFGVGLKNVRERLRTLFGQDAELEAGPVDGGWTSRVILPWTVKA